MTRYLAPSEEAAPDTKFPTTAASLFRHRHFKGTVWSVATMTFALSVVWLIARSVMI